MSWVILLAVAALVGVARARTGPSLSFSNSGREATGKAAADSEALDEMLAAVKVESDPIARHRLLTRIVANAYKDRRQPGMQKIFFRFAAIHLNEFPRLAPALTAASGGRLPNVGTFKLLTLALEETGRYEEAVRVCEQALQNGMTDGTKTGFDGRIKRLRKKMPPAKSNLRPIR